MRRNGIRVAAMLGTAVVAAGSLLAAGAGAAVAGVPIVTAAVAGNLNGVSCASAKSCMAVGGHLGTQKGPGENLAERWTGKTWSTVATPVPSGADGSALYGVTCTSTKNCVAAGVYDTASHDSRAFAEHWNGSKWSLTPVPVPKGSSNSVLLATACGSATACWAVGESGNNTLVDRWNGKKWSLVSSPTPHPAKPNVLNGLACSGTRECWAVGYDFPGTASGGLTEGWNGKSWRSVTTPGSKNSELIGAACARPATCFSVGIGDSFFALAQRWTGKKWVATASPRPKGAVSTQLNAAACAGPSACLAVGQYAIGSKDRVLAQRWTGTRWVAVTATTPVGANVATLSGAACVTASNCWAVGRAQTTKATTVLIEHWNGKAWSVR